ncbi:MAG: tRNA lysidine(34) synthetase TilS [Pseudomonadota bacterium]
MAAFSGGPDSTALLYLCRGLKDEISRIYAAHLDHGLRGPRGHQDLAAAQTEAEKLGLPFYSEFADCRHLAKETSRSIEEAAREARYAFLERVRVKTGADFIVTGHTADDNAEAVLINLLRGAGPQGLAGIPPRRQAVIRPLLGFWRRDLTDYLTRRGLSWVEDETNQDLDFTRNRVRHDLIPRLERDYNPAVKQALVRTAQVIRDEERVWAGVMSQARTRTGFEFEERRVRIRLSGLPVLDRAVARRLIREAAVEVQGSTRALSWDHVELVLDWAASEKGGGLDLPGDLRVWKEEGLLILGPAPANKKIEFEYRLGVPGEVYISELNLRLKTEVVRQTEKIDPRALGPAQAALDLEQVSLPLTVRSPRAGDRFQPLGLEGTKKLSDFFIDARVPAGVRAKVPLVWDSLGIVWVGGMRPAERVRVGRRTQAVLLISLG